MPPLYTRVFRVRYYECDAYGHVNNVNYLRYMQEAAFDASAAVGYDFARYQSMGRHWLIRRTDIEYLRPLHYGDSVEVKTWVMDFHRVRSRRAYEMRSLASGELAARAVTDWVFVDTASNRPVRVPPEMVAAFMGETPSQAEVPPREPFPEPAPPPPGVFRTRRRVSWTDIDTAQHVNNIMYMVYVEACSMDVLSAHGWSIPRMTAEGFGMVLRRHQIEYLQPAVLGDEIEIATWVYDVKRASATRHYVLTRVSDGALLARVNTTAAWIDLASGRPIRIPTHFMADFAPNASVQTPTA
ncbi:MAG: thioesterase family protein [Anaerolineae bacterium]|nr:acyl-CoA thioesterase [Thermoflexales bacterium]MDW8406682.1 thioesterase family protein [Anaerolineae bacterium]